MTTTPLLPSRAKNEEIFIFFSFIFHSSFGTTTTTTKHVVFIILSQIIIVVSNERVHELSFQLSGLFAPEMFRHDRHTVVHDVFL